MSLGGKAGVLSLAAFQLYGEWETDDGIAILSVPSPASGETAVIEPNGYMYFNWVPQSGETLLVDFRKLNDNNLWRVSCGQAGGSIQLQKIVSGTPTTISSGTQTWTPGTTYRIAIRCAGSQIRAFVNSVSKVNTADTFNQNETGFKISGFSSGSRLEIYPRTISGTPLRELLEHLPL
jgi:hypothetical protein